MFLMKNNRSQLPSSSFPLLQRNHFQLCLCASLLYPSGRKHCHLSFLLWALYGDFPLWKMRTLYLILLIHTTHDQFPSSQYSYSSVLIRKIFRVYVIMTIYAIQTWGIYETTFFLPPQLIPGVSNFLSSCLHIFVCLFFLCVYFM